MTMEFALRPSADGLRGKQREAAAGQWRTGS